ncbi:MAG: hypothetical protein OXF79_20395 [Chloroflexi bacterium]|nr:hypothetical protein [Chloroflexota bacterium]
MVRPPGWRRGDRSPAPQFVRKTPPSASSPRTVLWRWVGAVHIRMGTTAMAFPAVTAVVVIGNVADFEAMVAEAAKPWPPE